MVEPDNALIYATLQKVQAGITDLRNGMTDLRQDMRGLLNEIYILQNASETRRERWIYLRNTVLDCRITLRRDFTPRRLNVPDARQLGAHAKLFPPL